MKKCKKYFLSYTVDSHMDCLCSVCGAYMECIVLFLMKQIKSQEGCQLQTLRVGRATNPIFNDLEIRLIKLSLSPEFPLKLQSLNLKSPL